MVISMMVAGIELVLFKWPTIKYENIVIIVNDCRFAQGTQALYYNIWKLTKFFF